MGYSLVSHGRDQVYECPFFAQRVRNGRVSVKVCLNDTDQQDARFMTFVKLCLPVPSA